jgi:hypothetical protein
MNIENGFRKRTEMRSLFFNSILLSSMGCASPPEEHLGWEESHLRRGMRCLGALADSTGREGYGLLKAAGIEPEPGDGNLGMTEIDVPESDAPRAMKVLLEWRAKKGKYSFIAADEMRERDVLERIYQCQFREGMRDLASRHYASAAGHLSTAVSLRPTSYEALYARACVRLQWGRLDDAREDCRRILRLDPFDPSGDGFKVKAATLMKELEDQ